MTPSTDDTTALVETTALRLIQEQRDRCGHQQFHAGYDAAIRDLANALSAALTQPASPTPAEDVTDLRAADAELASRMATACDRTRAVRGRGEVAVQTSDWHALMSLGEMARRRRAALTKGPTA